MSLYDNVRKIFNLDVKLRCSVEFYNKLLAFVVFREESESASFFENTTGRIAAERMRNTHGLREKKKQIFYINMEAIS